MGEEGSVGWGGATVPYPPAERQDVWLETRDNGEATEVVGRKEGGKEIAK